MPFIFLFVLFCVYFIVKVNRLTRIRKIELLYVNVVSNLFY